MKRFCIAFSDKTEQESAYKDIFQQINGNGSNPILIIFFSSNSLFWYSSTNLKKDFPQACVIGTTSNKIFNSIGYSDKGVTALAVFSGIECQSGILFEVQRHPRNYINHLRNALKPFSSYENMCCLEFTTANSKGEELVVDTFNYLLKDKQIPVFGSTSGNDDNCEYTLVSLNGELYQNTCVFVLIKNLNGKIITYKENIFKKKGVTLIPTDADVDEQIVYEFNNKPAADEIADKIGKTVQDLPELLKKYPIGRCDGNEIYITQGYKIFEDGSISFLSKIYNHTKVELLEVDDLNKVWNKTYNDLKDKVKEDSFLVIVNCSSRTELFETDNCFDLFFNNLKKISNSFIGISGLGEQLGTVNLNQTMIILIIE